VRPNFKLLTSFLVDIRTRKYRIPLNPSWQRNRSVHFGVGPLGGFHYFQCALVQYSMIISFHTNSDDFMRSGHGDYLPWLSRKLASCLERICKIKPYDERGRGKDMEESICRQRQIFVFACSLCFSLRKCLFKVQFVLLFARVLLYRPYFSRSVRKLALFATFTSAGLDESLLLTQLAGFWVWSSWIWLSVFLVKLLGRIIHEPGV
jgi:hypothetical protein